MHTWEINVSKSRFPRDNIEPIIQQRAKALLWKLLLGQMEKFIAQSYLLFQWRCGPRPLLFENTLQNNFWVKFIRLYVNILINRFCIQPIQNTLWKMNFWNSFYFCIFEGYRSEAYWESFWKKISLYLLIDHDVNLSLLSAAANYSEVLLVADWLPAKESKKDVEVD